MDYALKNLVYPITDATKPITNINPIKDTLSVNCPELKTDQFAATDCCPIVCDVLDTLTQLVPSNVASPSELSLTAAIFQIINNAIAPNTTANPMFQIILLGFDIAIFI